jgi:CDP-glucose 4,6-dehydratase
VEDVVSTHNSWQSRRVLVTGAAGFVGSHLATALVDLGATVVAIIRDHPSGQELERLTHGGRVSLVFGSVSDYPVVERAMNEYEVSDVFHLAAQALVGPANRSPMSTFEANIQGTWCVLEAARLSPLVSRVVVASSDKAYGTQPVLPYTEDMPLRGLNPYDASKSAADLLAQTYAHAYQAPVVISRCANIYGPGDRNYSRLVPGTIRAALAGERPVIRSDGTPLRDYIHVDDAVRAYLVLGARALDEDVRGQAFNFGANRPVNVLDLARMILEAGGRGDIEPEVVGTATNEIDRQFLDSTRAREVLGWRAEVGLEEGLRQTVEGYRRHFEEHGFGD